MTSRLPVTALAQINTTVGALGENSDRIAAAGREAVERGAGLVVFPELALTGYPAEDLYLRSDFIAASREALDDLAPRLSGATFLVGFAEPVPDRIPGRAAAWNAAALIEDGALVGIYRKRLLPNYGVFDEFRTFRNGADPLVSTVAGARVGITICEDCWEPDSPVASELGPGADLIANLSASPFHRGKAKEREEIFRAVARRTGCAVAMTNLVGGQDELVFDGSSVAVSPEGEILARASRFEEEIVIVEWDGDPIAEPLSDLEEIYGALILGLRDYVDKNGFEHVGIGLSGGIDSALVAALAVDALGPHRVSCVVMPSPFSSDETQSDARELAGNLGCELIEHPIEGLMDSYRGALGRDSEGVSGENIQARIRGNLLMALSNARGWLILVTSNKSEASVGYSTLYGDMAGGFAPLRDVPKTLVFELCSYRNRDGGPIPDSIIERPPSAELRADQLDTDSLPDYEELDRILALYVEQDLGPAEIVASGEDRDAVRRVVSLVDGAEYKRRQSPPGIRVTTRAFGRDRRMPVTNRFRSDL
jgi:NAD+ synthase (glutamine-hydrolysing)